MADNVGDAGKAPVKKDEVVIFPDKPQGEGEDVPEEEPNPAWDMFVEKLAPTHRKRAKMSAGVPITPCGKQCGCTKKRAGWWKYQYGIAFPLSMIVLPLNILLFVGCIVYFTFIADDYKGHELFRKSTFDAVHDDKDHPFHGKMLLFLIHNPKYFAPFGLSLVTLFVTYNFAIIAPVAVKWFHIVWRREHCKKLSLSYVTNLTEAFDSAADNMRVWYMHVFIATTFCSLFVSPRAAAGCVALWSMSRTLTPFGMLVDNPIPQTILMALGTFSMYRMMLYSAFTVMTRELFPEWFYDAVQPALNLDLALMI